MSTVQRRPRQPDEEAYDQERPRQRQRRIASEESDAAVEHEDMDGDEERDELTETQLAKNLVRYALACEYSRTPIRRDGIREKVLGSHSRLFRKVFDCAQTQLRVVFGMELVELPVRDKSTMSVEEHRRSAKSQSKSQSKGPTNSSAYVLVTTIPDVLRSASVIAPSGARGAESEATYVALYSLIITAIALNRGELSDQKLKRYLLRMNVEVNTPLEKTDLLLQRLIRQGYIIKSVEKNPQSDEDSITWHVGPRGRLELTDESMASIVREVYSDAADDDLERRLGVSLRVEGRKPLRSGTGRAPGAGPEGNDKSREEEVDGEPAND